MIQKLKEEKVRKLTLLGDQVSDLAQAAVGVVTKNSINFLFCFVSHSHQYEQSIADMLQKQSLHLDESQEFECQKLKNRLQYEMDVLMAYQKKNRMQSQTQRERERKELEERVSVRRALLESKVSRI